jgi:hypothetical protein
MSITSSTILVELSMSVWTANKLDRVATNTVISDNQAAYGAAQVHKNLMAGTTLRKEIAEYSSSCYAWHCRNTVPWADRGPRLLPTSMFIDYKSELNVRKAKFEALTEEFCTFYPGWLDQQVAAQTARSLGGMFNIADYPSVDEVRSKFGFRAAFTPVPESGDFRVDIPRHDLEEVKQRYDEEFDSRLAGAMQEPWNRLYTVLKALSAKLEDGDEKKRYHDTLVSNATNLCALLTHLNITKDPALERARHEVESLMAGVTISDIKDSATLREGLKSKVDTILGGYEW